MRMRNQEQTKKQNWYNDRFVLLFIAVYVIIPVILIIFKDKVNNDSISLTTIVIILLAIAPICYLSIRIADLITRKVLAKNLIKSAISDEIHKEIKVVEVKKVKDALNRNEVKEAIKTLLDAGANDEVKKQATANIVDSLIDSQTVQKAILDAIIKEIKAENTKTLDNDKKKIVDKIIQKVTKKCQMNKIISAVLNVTDVKDKIATALNEKDNLKNVIKTLLQNDAMNVNEMKTMISAALNDEDGKIKVAVEELFSALDINATIITALKDKNVIAEIEAALDEQEKKIVKKAIDISLNDDGVISAIATTLKDRVIRILDNEIQSKIGESVQNAVNNEKETQKYRFTERVVEEICKNNKSEGATIHAIENLIACILNNDIKEHFAEMFGENGKLCFTIRDLYGKELVLSFDSTGKCETPSDNGDYKLRNGFTITVEDNKIKDIDQKK